MLPRPSEKARRGKVRAQGKREAPFVRAEGLSPKNQAADNGNTP